MKRRLSALLALLFLARMLPLSAQSSDALLETLPADRITGIAPARTSITIRANVSGAEVYLNGNFEGTTALTIRDLPAGRYHLRLEKHGYERRDAMIHVRAGQAQEFYLELRRRTGLVSITSQPAGALIFVDGNRVTENPARIPEGDHTITARLFGYTEQRQQVFVPARTMQNLTFSLSPAPFTLSALRTNKARFNPALPGTLGKIQVSFSVTNHGHARAQILDEHGEEIYAADFADFFTWEQSFTWNGKNPLGFTAEDGRYTARLTAYGAEDDGSGETGGAQVQEITFAVDSSIRVPFATTTPNGSGIGTETAAWCYPKRTAVFAVQGGADFQNKGRRLYDAPLAVSFLYAPLDGLELSTFVTVRLATDNAAHTPLQYGGAVKYSTSKKLSAAQIDFAAFAKLAGSTQTVFAPYGADTGTGLGGGAALGVEFRQWYVGATSSVTWGTVRGISRHNDLVWKNTVMAHVQLGATAVGAYGALSSSFGHTANGADTRHGTDWTRALETGIDVHLQIAGSPVYLVAGANGIIYSGEKWYIRTQAGFQILF